MKELIADACEKAFGSSAQKNAVVDKLNKINKGKNAEETEKVQNETQKKVIKAIPKNAMSAEHEKVGKGKRKQANASRFFEWEEDVSGNLIHSNCRNFFDKVKNRKLSQQVQQMSNVESDDDGNPERQRMNQDQTLTTIFFQ